MEHVAKTVQVATKLTHFAIFRTAFFNTSMQFFQFGEPDQFNLKLERSLQQTPKPFPSVL